MNSEALGLVRELFTEIDAAVPRNPDEQTNHARELFELLSLEGGEIKALDDPAYQRTRIDELGTWTEDPWDGPTYGIDGSTTRPLEYNNGLVVDTAHAKTAVAGDTSDRSIERDGHIAGVAYLDDADTTLRSQTIETEHLTAELVPFPESAEELQNISKSVSAVAQGLGESKQAVESLEAVDGPLFLDGSVLPLGIAYWLLLDHAGNRSPAGTWDIPSEIVGNYIEVIDRQYERENPVIGVVKTSSMSQVLSALQEKIAQHDVRDDSGRLVDTPWVRDHQFVSEVLRHDNLDYLTYSSWFVQRGQEIGGQLYEVLQPLAGKLNHGTPSDYRRAFCYVRLPRDGGIFRIEVPYLMIQDKQSRHETRLKALKEIAQRRGVPRVINRADRIARIGQENRDTIENMIERTESSYNYNWDGRWSDLTDDTNL